MSYIEILEQIKQAGSQGMPEPQGFPAELRHCVEAQAVNGVTWVRLGPAGYAELDRLRAAVAPATTSEPEPVAAPPVSWGDAPAAPLGEPVKRKRGRPRKVDVGDEPTAAPKAPIRKPAPSAPPLAPAVPWGGSSAPAVDDEPTPEPVDVPHVTHSAPYDDGLYPIDEGVEIPVSALARTRATAQTLKTGQSFFAPGVPFEQAQAVLDTIPNSSVYRVVFSIDLGGCRIWRVS